METLVRVAPFIFGLFLSAIAPELSRAARSRIEAVITKESAAAATNPADIPPYLRTEYIGDYVEYAADAAQAVPFLLLPFVGAVMALRDSSRVVTTILLIIVVVPATIYALLKVINADPVRYIAQRRWWGRYTFLPLLSMAVNALAIALVILLY
jgi:hypothetical protein